MKFISNHPLADKTTFHLGGRAAYYTTVATKRQLLSAVNFAQKKSLPLFVLGSGSNVLLSDTDLTALVLHFSTAKIAYHPRTHLLTAQAGVLWDNLVAYAVEHQLQGVECLSGIPGTVGAAPIQNIGAYGQELRDTFHSLLAFDLHRRRFITLTKSQCQLRYRSSRFQLPGQTNRYLIWSVTLKLRPHAPATLRYPTLRELFLDTQPTLNEVRTTILKLRAAKLEDWRINGNAGSYFKNPLISPTQFAVLQRRFPNLPHFPDPSGQIKLFAGWLIEQAGWKDRRFQQVAVSAKNALVLINPHHRGTSAQVLQLAGLIVHDVQAKFGLTLKPEVQYIHFPPRVHFLGIGGSGMSAVALLAQHAGFSVSGCDLQSATPYLDKCRRAGIPISHGHHRRHLQNVDYLAVTAAAFYEKHPPTEFTLAQKTGQFISWQEFMARFLHPGKAVISIAGTNGKSTTTALASLFFEAANLDPSVMIGATVKLWQANYRFGSGRHFIVESDEFFDNFLAYHPDILILNNIEFDHPDYFSSFSAVLHSFRRFLHQLTGQKILIFNQDDPGIRQLFASLSPAYLSKLQLFGYTLSPHPLIPASNSTRAFITKRTTDSTYFRVTNRHLDFQTEFRLTLPGDYNVSNALGVINLALSQDLSLIPLKHVLSTFSGIGRRLDHLGTPQGIILYDDYGHHPSAIQVTLQALRQKHPHLPLWAVVEPHGFSRTKATLPLYHAAFTLADQVIITPIFRSRDQQDFGVSGQSIVAAARHPHLLYLDSFPQIADFVAAHLPSPAVLVVFGAGNSYYLARDLLKRLSSTKR